MISEAAKREHRIAHAFGTKPSRASQFAPIVSQLVDKLGVTELLDYGCGKGELAAHLKASHEVKIQLYDPCVEEYSGDAIPMQMVACIDVLNVVEQEYLDAVLNDLERVTGVVFFAVIGESEYHAERWFEITVW